MTARRAGGIGVLSLCYASYAYFWGCWVVIFAGFLSAHGLTPGEGSTRLAVLSVTAIGAMTLLAPRLARASPRRTIALALAIQGVGALLIAHSPTAWLFPAFALTGIGTGLVDVFVNAAGQSLEARTRSPVLQYVHAMYGVGGAIAALFSGVALANGATLAGVLWSAGLVQIVAAAVCFRSSRLASTARDGGAPGAVFSMVALARWPYLLGPSFIVLAAFFIEGSMDVWSVIYLRRTLGASTLAGGSGFAAFALATTVGRLFAARVLFRMGYRRTIILSGLGSMVAGLLAVTAETPVGASGAFLLLGLCVSAAAPAAFGLAGRSSDASLAIAAMTTIGYSGFVLGPPLLGWLADRAGLRATMASLMAATAVIPVCGLLARRRSDEAEPELDLGRA